MYLVCIHLCSASFTGHPICEIMILLGLEVVVITVLPRACISPTDGHLGGSFGAVIKRDAIHIFEHVFW